MALSLSGMTYGGSAADKVLRMIFPPKTIARLSSVTKGLIMFGTAYYRDMCHILAVFASCISECGSRRVYFEACIPK